MTLNSNRAKQDVAPSVIVKLAVMNVLRQLGCQVDESQFGIDEAEAQSSLDAQVHGAFVTLRRNGRLRACYGNFDASGKARNAVSAAAIAATQRDFRFPAFSRRELPFLELDVSLLINYQAVQGPPKKRADTLEIGRHGIVIHNNQKSALLLPQVATEWNWNAKQFLEQLCRKAGLSHNAWMESKSELHTFEAVVEETSIHRFLTPLQINELTSPVAVPIKEIAQHVSRCIDVSDSALAAKGQWPSIDIHGIIGRVRNSKNRQGIRFGRLSLFEKLTLEESVKWCVTKARQLESRWKDFSNSSNETEVELTLLHSPATHLVPADLSDRLTLVKGSGEIPIESAHRTCDLEGFEPTQHALIWSVDSNGERGEFGCSFEPYLDWCTQSQSLQNSLARNYSSAGHWLSMEVASTRPWERWDGSTYDRTSWANPPLDRELNLTDRRPPAVAGMFYSDDPDRLERDVRRCFEPETTDRAPAVAIQVPHAGLAFSGRIAAQAMSSVLIPESVIILSPKHRREGENWSICTCSHWETIGHQFETDRDLFFRLLENIDGLLPDDAAHNNEHGIEIQLPLLARVAPHTKIVGITIGNASLADCLQFAEGLATTIKLCDTPPLLIISSDMNHFATDTENRRLDEIALQAIETLDCKHIYRAIVEEHGITMCGVRPNVIALAALKSLGQIGRCDRIGYTTSAEVSGDSSSVVGYAGLRFRE